LAKNLATTLPGCTSFWGKRLQYCALKRVKPVQNGRNFAPIFKPRYLMYGGAGLGGIYLAQWMVTGKRPDWTSTFLGRQERKIDDTLHDVRSKVTIQETKTKTKLRLEHRCTARGKMQAAFLSKF
jgi:hypothetical protein